jgi:hypothetical protein
MYTIEQETDFGIIEQRTYDDKDRLVGINRIQPPHVPVKGRTNRAHMPGARTAHYED